MLPVAQRCKVHSLLKDTKSNNSLKGRSFPDGEETWHLFANWLPIAKSLHLTPHVTTIVEDMGKLLTAIYRWTFDPFVQGCAHIAKRFQNTICPQKCSPYLLWLRNERATVLGNLQPWGGAMFCGDIVESLNYVLKDNFLTTSSLGGGRKATKEEKDEAMLRHAHEGTFLYNEMPRWDGRRRREDEHVVQAQLEVGAGVHGVGDHPMLVHTHPKDDSPLTGEIALGDFLGEELFTSALLCANGPFRAASIRRGTIYYGDTVWILDVGSCLTLLGPTCLCRGLDSALCWYRTRVLPRDVCLSRCTMNWSRLASQR